MRKYEVAIGNGYTPMGEYKRFHRHADCPWELAEEVAKGLLSQEDFEEIDGVENDGGVIYAIFDDDGTPTFIIEVTPL